MAGRIGGAGGKDPTTSAGVEETGAIEAGLSAAAGDVADHSGAPNAKRTVRAKSMDMGGIDLLSRLNAKLDGAGGGDAAQARKDAKDVADFAKDISGAVVTAELDARIAQARELLGSGLLDKTTEKSLQGALATLLEVSESQGQGDSGVYGDEIALIPVPEFDAAIDKASGNGIDAKEAKALVALAEKMIKDAPDPSATFMAIGDKIHIMTNNLELPEAAAATLTDANSSLWVTMQKTSMARIDAAAKKLGDHLKANAGSLKGPLANIDPKSLGKADAGDSYHLCFKLKNGKTGTLESDEGKALAKLLEKDPKLASVTVGVPKAFIE